VNYLMRSRLEQFQLLAEVLLGWGEGTCWSYEGEAASRYLERPRSLRLCT